MSPRYRYPVTSQMVTQDMLDVLIRLAENTSDSDRTEPRIRRSLAVESVTAIEQLCRILDERYSAAGGSGKEGEEKKVETIADTQEDVYVGARRLDASERGYQSARSYAGLAKEHGIAPLSEWLGVAANMEDVEEMVDDRHAVIHTVGFKRLDAAKSCSTARSFARAALADWPHDLVAAALIEGNKLDAAGRHGEARLAYEEALAVCRAVIDSGGGGAWVHVCAGHALARLGRTGEAEASYRKAMAEDPGDAVARLEMGNLLLTEDGRLEEAEAEYEASAKLNPEYAPAYVARGHSLLIRPGEDGAMGVERYGDALVLDPDGMPAHMGLGLAMAKKRRHARAISHFRIAADLDADDVAPRVALGNSLSALDLHGDAIEVFEDAVRIAMEVGFSTAAHRGLPAEGRRTATHMRSGLGGAGAYRGLASALLSADRFKDAESAYLRAVALDADNPKVHLGLAESRFRLDMYRKAVRSYRIAVALDDGNPDAHVGLAGSLAQLGMHGEAARSYYEAVVLDDGNPNVHFSLAESLFQLGRYGEAARSYRETIELDVEYAVAHAGLVESLFLLGRYGESADVCIRAMKLGPRFEYEIRKRFDGPQAKMGKDGEDTATV